MTAHVEQSSRREDRPSSRHERIDGQAIGIDSSVERVEKLAGESESRLDVST
jgi:hypothetical protein